MQTSPKDKRTCNHCGKPLLGRSDQSYCNDTCRNTFNRKKRQEIKSSYNPEIPEIIKIIKRNYEILKSLPSMVESKVKDYIPRDVLKEHGVDTRFYTSTYVDHEGKIWHCVFERCYLKGANYVHIKDIPEKGML